MIRRNTSSPRTTPRIRVARNTCLVRPKRDQITPPMKMMIRHTKFLFLLDTRRLARATRIRFLPLVSTLTTLRSLSTPLGNFKIRSRGIVIVLCRSMTIPTSVSLQSRLPVRSHKICRRTSYLVPNLPLRRGVILTTTIMLPMKSILHPNSKSVTSNTRTMTTMSSLTITVFRPSIPSNVTPNRHKTRHFTNLHFFNSKIRPINMFFRRSTSTINNTLRRRLRLPHLTIRRNNTMILPRRARRSDRYNCHSSTSNRQRPRNTRHLRTCLFQNILLRARSSFKTILLFLSGGIVVLFVAVRPGFPIEGIRKIAVSCRILVMSSSPTVYGLLSGIVVDGRVSPLIIGDNTTTLSLVTQRDDALSVVLVSVALNSVRNFSIVRAVQHGNIAAPIVVVDNHGRSCSFVCNLSLNTSSCIAGPFHPRVLNTGIGTLVHHDGDFSRRGGRRVDYNPFLYSAAAVHFCGDGIRLGLSRGRHDLLLLFIHRPRRIFAGSVVCRRV